MQQTYKIEVDCANCAREMEEAAAKVAGVTEVTVNFMTQKMIVVFTPDADPASVMKEVRKACLKAASDCEVFL